MPRATQSATYDLPVKAVLHGDQETALYKREQELLNQLREQNVPISSLNLSKIEPDQLTENLQTTSLFGGDRAFHISQWEKVRSTNFKKAVAEQLGSSSDSAVVTIAKKLTKNQEKIWSDQGFSIERFTTSPAVFQFLEAIKTKPINTTFELYQQALQESPSIWSLHFLLTRQVDYLLAAHTGATIKAAPFVQRKLQSQAKRFTLQQLLMLSHGLYTIEKNFKTGQNKLSWDTQFDVLLTQLYLDDTKN